MSAPAFDPNAIMEEVFANAGASLPATIATLRHNGPNCRKVATVATPHASNLARDCRNVAIVATGGVADDEIAALIEERAALCAGSVPAIYLDAWSRLCHQKPMRVSESEWRQALDDGGRFLDRWASEAALWGWTVADLFDVPREGRRGGLIWFLRNEPIVAFGPEHARTEGGRVFDRNSA
jgi:hypothetical protein